MHPHPWGGTAQLRAQVKRQGGRSHGQGGHRACLTPAGLSSTTSPVEGPTEHPHGRPAGVRVASLSCRATCQAPPQGLREEGDPRPRPQSDKTEPGAQTWSESWQRARRFAESTQQTRARQPERGTPASRLLPLQARSNGTETLGCSGKHRGAAGPAVAEQVGLTWPAGAEV